MKKLFAFISVLAVASACLFAEITAKKLADGKIEATFFYGNPRAVEVLVAGDFTNWQNGALPMTKSDKGFTLTKTFEPGTTVKYKFISDGSWTTDLRAPDFVDDGFGGKNSMADLDALADGGNAAAPKSGLKFLTWSMLGAQMKFLTDDDKAQELDKGLVSAGINLKSYMKVTGNALPNVPVYFEIAVAEQDSFDNLYNQDITDFDDGIKNFGSGLLFAPVHILNGEKTAGTYLGHFKFGIDTKYVNWTTGYKYAKLPPHSINDWITVDKEWEAGYKEVGGFNYFELGPALQQIGPVSLKLAVAPNKAADRAGSQFGFFGWFDLSTGPAFNLGFQYNTALGKTFDTIFGHCYEQDFIVGYKGIFGPLTLKANYLANIYGDGDLTKEDGVTYYSKFIPSTSDVGVVESEQSPLTNMAANVQANFSNDTLNATVGYRFRGKQAGMMYVEDGADDHTNISDQLGKVNHQRIFADVNANVSSALNIGVSPYVQMVLDKDKDYSKVSKVDDGMKIRAKPYFALDLDEAFYIPSKLSGYVDFAYYTAEEDKVASAFGTEQFTIEAAGLTYDHNFAGKVLKTGKIQYCFDNTDKNYLFNTIITSWSLANDYGLQAGFGIRTLNKDSKKDDPNNPFGFYVGGMKKLPVLAKPTAYLQFMYAMDPYQKFGDGPTAYRFSSDYDNATKDGVTDYMDNYAIRVGLQWDL